MDQKRFTATTKNAAQKETRANQIYPILLFAGIARGTITKKQKHAKQEHKQRHHKNKRTSAGVQYIKTPPRSMCKPARMTCT